ncbi:GGDEF domain-containing protein [Campylobacter sputorum]|uniref:GGDEF domain-containing protein n=1 Tax=Campylobacter sputorum TaxID=206 RepID=UPI00053C05DB|nr:GGDEF domain-containing protein [Campylobacter sputorum]
MQRISNIFLNKPKHVGIVCFFIFFIIISIPIIYTYEKRNSLAYEEFRHHLGMVAYALSFSVNPNLHKIVEDEQNASSDNYQKVTAPLFDFFALYREIYDIYTVVKRDGKKYYVLDVTNAQNSIAKDPIASPAEIMEELAETDNSDNWFEVVESGKVYINKDFETDNYGTFLSAIAPVYDKNQTFVAAIGIDVSIEKYKEIMQKTRNIFILTMIMAAMISLLMSIIVIALINYVKLFYYRLQKVSNSDRLTGVYNRFVFIDIFTREMNRVKRNKDNLYLIFLDIDNFKSFNDKYGHSVGDDIIIFTAKKIANTVRKIDIVSRYGGDEFLISICGASDEFIKDIIDRVMNQKYDFVYAVNKNGIEEKLVVNFSVGYTKYKDGDTFETMLERADRGLYISKDFGKHRATFVEK